jgi:hypothetical protein
MLDDAIIRGEEAVPRTKLPDERLGQTTHLRLLHKDGTLDMYLRVSYYEDGRVGEIFCSNGHSEEATEAKPEDKKSPRGWLDLTMTMVSIGLQYGADYAVLIGKLRGQRFKPDGTLLNVPLYMRDASGSPNLMVNSPADAVARFMEARYPGGFDATLHNAWLERERMKADARAEADKKTEKKQEATQGDGQQTEATAPE